MSRHPKIERYSAYSGLYTAPSGTGLIKVRLVAGGGAGASTSNAHFIPRAQYGDRGEDSMFGLHPFQWGMFAMTPEKVDVYVAGELSGSKAIVIRELPAGVTGIDLNRPYWPINIEDLGSGVIRFNLSETPYYHPFGEQAPIIAGPLYENPSIMFHRVWYGVEGGGGGGIIGDQGTPGGLWGFADIGPNGDVQSEGVQGGPGSGLWKMGPGGGVNPMGGNSGNSYQDFGIAGVNLAGSGGGGAPPPVGTSALGEWAGCSGAAGAYGEIEYDPDSVISGFIPWFWAGKGGLAQPPGTGGYKGGDGGHGQVRFKAYPISSWST